MEESEKIALYSIITNVVLVFIKGILSFFSGSVALMADAIHSLTDVVSSATVFVGIKISKRKYKTFPYGLYKVENFVSLLSSVFIVIAGYEIVKTVFYESRQLKTEYLPYAIAGVLLSMAITFAFSRYELRRGEELGSPSLIADAKHIHTDMLSSIVILAGLTGGWFGLPLDRIAALLVVILVIKSGFSIFVDALRVLLDASIDFETMDRVKTIILKDPNVISINELMGRNSGRFKFIEADIVIKVKGLEKAYYITKKIEEDIKRQILQVDHILIHYEPQRKEMRLLAIPLEEDRYTVSEHFGEAPYFYFATLRESDREIISESYYRNPFMNEEKAKGIKVSEWLLEYGIDTIYSQKEFTGKGPGYVFSDAMVEIVLTKEKTIDEIKSILVK